MDNSERNPNINDLISRNNNNNQTIALADTVRFRGQAVVAPSLNPITIARINRRVESFGPISRSSTSRSRGNTARVMEFVDENISGNLNQEIQRK